MKTRKCSVCKKDLPETTDNFATRERKKGTVFQNTCKPCHREYRKTHYEKNKDKYIKKAAVFTKSIVDWFQDIRKDFVCQKCGENRWWVLDFHHRDPKSKEDNVAQLIRKGSKPKILNEMKKCDILCSNCHRDFHYQEKQAGNA